MTTKVAELEAQLEIAHSKQQRLESATAQSSQMQQQGIDPSGRSVTMMDSIDAMYDDEE